MTILHSEIYKDGDEQPILTDINEVLSFYLTYGCHDTDLFYEKIRTYDSLKFRPLRVCCVCGIREMLRENESELQDALPFKYLLAVKKEELIDFLALKKDDDDWRGALAQESYHIELVEYDKTYYHILDLDESRGKSKDDMTLSLIREGKLTKLPACISCYARLRMANKYFKKNKGSPEAFEKAIAMLKPLSFKRCDLGRLPKSLPKLSYCE